MEHDDLLAHLAALQLRAWGGRVTARDVLGRPTLAEQRKLRELAARARPEP